jgi:hypothetical protein
MHTLRRNNVTPLSVRVLKQSNVRRSIRIVLKTLYYRWNTIFGALPINNSIMLLMTAASMTSGYPASVISTASL